MNGALGARPRVLSLDLGDPRGLARARPEPWSANEPWLERLGSWSGGALGLAWIARRALREPEAPAPLVVSVGELVRRGFPTAARASVASRAPLTGLFSEGLVGGSLGRRLARITDALVLDGRAELRGGVLTLEADGSARTFEWPELAGLAPRDVHARLVERLGPCATLSIGLAGERRLPLASLASGGDVPHFVGRGGLGAVLGRLGLKAVAVLAPEVESEPQRDLVATLSRSPRLLARSEGGTLELFGAFASGPEGGAARAELARLEGEARGARVRRHGCAGCPTPCGWEFDTRRGVAQAARFGASHALARALGFERLDDALVLLGRCDELGLDAKELGATLALLGPVTLERALTLVDEALEGTGEGARLRGGALALARELGLDPPAAKGAAVRADASLASLFGQCVSSRGGDPMRTFPFLAVDGADRAAFRASTGLDLPRGSDDPLDPAGKGRLVAWHEDWANALDTAGFCAFSAAALLADGTFGAAELAELLAPQALRADGLGMLDAGAALSILQRRLNERWGLAPFADLPLWARERLLQPGVWDDYARARGLEVDGRVSAERWAALERLEPWRVTFEGVAEPVAPSTPDLPRRPGRVTLRRTGEVARGVELALPAPLGEVLARARAGAASPAVFRAGQRLRSGELVHDGDVLDLVAVIAGG